MLNTDHVSCTSTCTNCGGLQSDPDLEFVANSVPGLIGQTFTVELYLRRRTAGI